MMKRLSLIALLLVLPLLCFAQQTDLPFQLTIKSDKQLYETNEEIWIKVAIKNNSGINYVLSSLGFEISSDNLKVAIYSPVKFSDNAFDDTPNEEEIKMLQPQEKIGLKYNLYTLKWDVIFPSLWPWANKSFNTYVQPGKYSIVLTMSGKPKDHTSEYLSFISNPITIEIVEKSVWKNRKPDVIYKDVKEYNDLKKCTGDSDCIASCAQSDCFNRPLVNDCLIIEEIKCACINKLCQKAQ